MTPSGCRPSSTRCAPAPTRGPPPRRTSPGTGRSCAGWVSGTTSGAASPPPTRSSSAGRSGSSPSCSRPGTTRTPPSRGRSARWSPSSRPAAAPTPDGRAWAELTHAEQHKVLAGYRLAYIDEAPVNWCPGLGTVLSNEEVTPDGRSAIGNFPVFRRSLRQWMMRITAYSDRLLDDLDRLDWPESVKAMQRNWIGRSYGARVDFPVARAPAGAGQPVDRGLHHPAGHPVRRDVHGAGAGTPAGRRGSPRRPGRPAPMPAGPAARPPRPRPSPTTGGRPPASPTWTGRRTSRRPVSSPAPTRSTRPTAPSCRSSSPTTC